jgi:peptidoglycan/xylan/chitin deacetylase (PgdA/CDA1 family)
MKIFLITKKNILFFVIIIFLLIGTFSLFSSQASLIVSANPYSILSEDTANKITNLSKAKEKVAYLTFDDGPSPNVTPKVLDILKEENIKASFFVIGKYVDSYPEITRRAYEEGHFIANHSYDHDNKILYKSESSFIDEIKKTDLAISNAIGVEGYSSHIFRFPTGYMSSHHKSEKKDCVKLLAQMDYTYIDWNCLNNDSMKKYSKEQLLNNLKKTMKGKDTLVILMHDTKFVSDSSTALKESIQYIKSLGYTFDNFYSIF